MPEFFVQNTKLVFLLVEVAAAFGIMYFALYFTSWTLHRLAGLRQAKSPLAAAFLHQKLYRTLGHIMAAFVLQLAAGFINNFPFLRSQYDSYASEILSKLSTLYLIFALTLFVIRLSYFLNDYYESKSKAAKSYPMQGYLRVLSFFIWTVGAIFFISFVFNKSPWGLVTGIGAVSAIFILLFQDTITGTVASIQATALSIVSIGDLIKIPSKAILGRIMDMSVATVKVKNPNNTVSTFPTKFLTTEVLINYHNLEFGDQIRVIKVEVYIDLNSLKALPDNSNNLRSYRLSLLAELASWKRFVPQSLRVIALAPTANGLPVEIQGKLKEATLSKVEELTGEILELALVRLGNFELKAYQSS